MSPTKLGPGCLALLGCLLSAPLTAQETGPGTAPARLRLSPSFWINGQYNRVEGLPVRLGPVLERGGANPFRLEALAIWRSERKLGRDPKAVGYRIDARQQWGTSRIFFVGAGAHSLVTPIEGRQISDVGASMATFFLHRDFRDHVAREGFSGYVGLNLPGSGLSARVTYTDEDHGFLPPTTTLAVSGESREWRPQPLVAEGRVRTVTAEVAFDDRDRAPGPHRGWRLTGRITTAVGGSMTQRAYMDESPAPPDTVATERVIETDFMTGSLEARRHLRLGRSVTLGVRGLVGGSLDGDPLPPQRQQALGGVGSLPGYFAFSADCGARARRFSVFYGDGAEATREPVFAAYGCDAAVLFQVELGGVLPFITWPDSYTVEDGFGDDWEPFVDLRLRWAVFFDAAKGWSLKEPGGAGPAGSDTEVLTDVGVGLKMATVGVYWAWPLGDGGRDRLFLRVAHRF